MLNLLGHFFLDDKTKEFSTAKFWNTLGLALVCYKYAQYDGINIIEFTVAVGVLVIGNSSINFLLKRKYGGDDQNNQMAAEQLDFNPDQPRRRFANRHVAMDRSSKP